MNNTFRLYITEKLVREGWFDDLKDSAGDLTQKALNDYGADALSMITNKPILDPENIKARAVKAVDDVTALTKAGADVKNSAGLVDVSDPSKPGNTILTAANGKDAITNATAGITGAGVLGGVGGTAAGYGVAQALGAGDIKIRIQQLESQKNMCKDPACFNRLESEIDALKSQYRLMSIAGTGLGAVGGALLGNRFGTPTK